MSNQFKNLIIVILALGLGVCLLYIFMNKNNVTVQESVVPLEQKQAVPQTVEPITQNNSDAQSQEAITLNANGIKTYRAQGFSFKYKDVAVVKQEPQNSDYTSLYSVFNKDGVGVLEMIGLHNGSVVPETVCGKVIQTHTTTLNGKNFTYCDSKAEPARTYFYTQNGKTVIIMAQGSSISDGKLYSYIIPESVEIN